MEKDSEVMMGGIASLFTTLYPSGLPIKRWIVMFVLVTLLAKFWRIVYVTIVTLPRDLKFVYRWSKLIIKTRNFERDNVTVVSIFSKRAEEYPDKACFYYEDETWTNSDVQTYSQKISHIFYKAGYRRGDVVALCMENRPEYVAIWLGLAQIGVIIALINTHLRLDPLRHCIDIVNPKGIVFSKQQAHSFREIATTLNNPIDMYVLSKDPDIGENSLKLLLKFASCSTLPLIDKELRNKDILFYIYTSGTTGMPKAAVIPHARYLIVTLATTTIIKLNKDDVMYNPLPLYHSAGGIIGTGPALVEGIPVVIKTKFSASNYITDCIKYKCTLGQYIGEMCRYILATPVLPTDRQHNLRMMIGNGLSSSIWPEFVNRFKLKQVTELYGATEGNVNIVNLDSTIGAVGFLPRFLPISIVGIGIIRYDTETGAPLRDSSGLCVQCDINEPGMFVGVISSRNASREFHGYVGRDESASKVIDNVFSFGDRAFVSGDTMIMDDYGYLYFKDRTGDTYRWKGENVATAEVEAVISRIVSLQDTTVYGVEIPGQEGRAGMVAIADPTGVLDIEALAQGLDKILPTYARPLILRVIKKMDMTGTFRVKKFKLQKEGFDPKKIKDKMYFRKGPGYEVLTLEAYDNIVSGKARL